MIEEVWVVTYLYLSGPAYIIQHLSGIGITTDPTQAVHFASRKEAMEFIKTHRHTWLNCSKMKVEQLYINQ